MRTNSRGWMAAGRAAALGWGVTGITPLDALGKPFDPNVHQAIKSEPSSEHAPNTVLDVVQQGYTIHERVMRPAAVIVSAST